MKNKTTYTENTFLANKVLESNLVVDALDSNSREQNLHLITLIDSLEAAGDRVLTIREASISNASQIQVADNTILICDLVTLRKWKKQLHSITLTYDLPDVWFQFSEFSDLQNRSMSTLANNYKMECGCTVGSYIMSITVIAIIVSFFISGGRLSNIHLTHIFHFVAITILGALFGKILGLLWARWQLLRLAINISRNISE